MALKSVEYWENQEASLDSILGGFGNLHEADVAHSKTTLDYIERRLSKFNRPHQHNRAADIGCGIGRVTKDVLSLRYREVHLFEPVEKLLNEARLQNQGQAYTFHSATVGDLQFPQGVQFDLIWMQWIAMYLSDALLIQFIKNAGSALAPNGFIVIKDNMTVNSKKRIHDDEDDSYIRTKTDWLDIAEATNMQILTNLVNTKWPSNLYSVITIAFQPKIQPNDC